MLYIGNPMHESKGYIKQVLVQIKTYEMKQFSNELNDPHGPPHCLGALMNNH